MSYTDLPENTIFLDLETQYLSHEVGGWSNIKDMKLAIAIIFSTRHGGFACFAEQEVGRLLEHLFEAELVIGFNIRRFDFVVLSAYTETDLQGIPNIDMLAHIHQQLGFRISLNTLATINLQQAKTATGTQAVQWYRHQEWDKLIAYCIQDVEITKDLYLLGKAQGFLHFRGHQGQLLKVPTNW